eukprot:7379465-Prymnesium_polylepis.2
MDSSDQLGGARRELIGWRRCAAEGRVVLVACTAVSFKARPRFTALRGNEGRGAHCQHQVFGPCVAGRWQGVASSGVGEGATFGSCTRERISMDVRLSL